MASKLAEQAHLAATRPHLARCWSGFWVLRMSPWLEARLQPHLRSQHLKVELVLEASAFQAAGVVCDRSEAAVRFWLGYRQSNLITVSNLNFIFSEESLKPYSPPLAGESVAKGGEGQLAGQKSLWQGPTLPSEGEEGQPGD